jgi:hypothetical protein
MRAPIDQARASNAGSSNLEDEVAAWLKRRALRPGATNGKVRVLRIPKRAPPQRAVRPITQPPTTNP